jgi:hypothetical protein
MFDANITLDNSSGNARTFSLIENKPRGSRRLMSLSTYAVPIDMNVDHSRDGTGVNVTDRHRILFTRTKLDQTGVLRKISCNVAIAADRAGEFTEDDAAELVAFATTFLWGESIYDAVGTPDFSNVTRLMQGES